jgi:uncharacterized protein (TIGR02453 family)
MKKVLEYLSALEANNDREWYQTNKKQYQEANAEFEELVQRLLFSVGKTDNDMLRLSPKDLTYKLARDVRFSNDKTPFNPTFRACISAGGKSPIPVGYYLSVAPANRSFLGGGLFATVFKDATTLIRDYIVEHGTEFEGIVSEKDFLACFTVNGEKLKNVPRGYDENLPQSQYLKNKSWYLQYSVSDDTLTAQSFVEEATQIFLSMKPFNDYLNAALKGFKMPAR